MCSHFSIEDRRGSKQHFQHIESGGKNTTEARGELCAAIGQSAVPDPTCPGRFVKLPAGDFSLHDAPGLGRSVEVDSDQIETLRTTDVYTMREIADILQVS